MFVFETAADVPIRLIELKGAPATSDLPDIVLLVIELLSLPVVTPVLINTTLLLLFASRIEFVTVLPDASLTKRIAGPVVVFLMVNELPPALRPLIVILSAPLKLSKAVALPPEMTRGAPPLA